MQLSRRVSTAGAVVMATGIVSVGFALDGETLLSRVLLVLAGAAWVALVLLLARGLRFGRPTVSVLTCVAGTEVLGARLAQLGWHREAAVLLAVGALLWVRLVPSVMRTRLPATGSSFLLVVATESLAVLAAAIAGGRSWLWVTAIVCAAAGLVLYVAVVAVFSVRELFGGHGDHWIAGGALAIAALACARVATVGHASGLANVALAVWSAAAAWLVALLVAEVTAPRPGYDAARWATVFPLGMYAVCSFAVAKAAGVGALADFARVWIWVAFAGWLAASSGISRRAVGQWRAGRRRRAG
ncbi:MAG TPA: hypothetical protein VJP39_02120 [Gaiellaceae bacterium]|nr:hypothetical protein [Gaiellaceae bacterium]